MLKNIPCRCPLAQPTLGQAKSLLFWQLLSEVLPYGLSPWLPTGVAPLSSSKTLQQQLCRKPEASRNRKGIIYITHMHVGGFFRQARSSQPVLTSIRIVVVVVVFFLCVWGFKGVKGLPMTYLGTRIRKHLTMGGTVLGSQICPNPNLSIKQDECSNFGGFSNLSSS